MTVSKHHFYLKILGIFQKSCRVDFLPSIGIIWDNILWCDICINLQYVTKVLHFGGLGVYIPIYWEGKI